MARTIIILLIVFFCGCLEAVRPPVCPPKLIIVKDPGDIGGVVGRCWTLNGASVIYLAPGADERTLTHELAHALGQDELGAQWAELYLWGMR